MTIFTVNAKLNALACTPTGVNNMFFMLFGISGYQRMGLHLFIIFIYIKTPFRCTELTGPRRDTLIVGLAVYQI